MSRRHALNLFLSGPTSDYLNESFGSGRAGATYFLEGLPQKLEVVWHSLPKEFQSGLNTAARALARQVQGSRPLVQSPVPVEKAIEVYIETVPALASLSWGEQTAAALKAILKMTPDCFGPAMQDPASRANFVLSEEASGYYTKTFEPSAIRRVAGALVDSIPILVDQAHKAVAKTPMEQQYLAQSLSLIELQNPVAGGNILPVALRGLANERLARGLKPLPAAFVERVLNMDTLSLFLAEVGLAHPRSRQGVKGAKEKLQRVSYRLSAKTAKNYTNMFPNFTAGITFAGETFLHLARTALFEELQGRFTSAEIKAIFAAGRSLGNTGGAGAGLMLVPALQSMRLKKSITDSVFLQLKDKLDNLSRFHLACLELVCSKLDDEDTEDTLTEAQWRSLLAC